MNWFDEYLEINNMNYYNASLDDSMMSESRPPFMGGPGHFPGGHGNLPGHFPGQFPPGHFPHHHFPHGHIIVPFWWFFFMNQNPGWNPNNNFDFDEDREQRNSNAYPYIIPYI